MPHWEPVVPVVGVTVNSTVSPITGLPALVTVTVTVSLLVFSATRDRPTAGVVEERQCSVR